jgi:hypothetical protein
MSFTCSFILFHSHLLCVCVMMMYILNQIMFFNHLTIHKYLLLELINWLLVHKHFYIIRLWFTERLGEIDMPTENVDYLLLDKKTL